MVVVAPSVVGAATSSIATTTGTTIVLTRPAGVQNGDMLVAFLRTNATSGTTDGWASGGWVRHGKAFLASDSQGRETGIYTHMVTDVTAEPSTYTFTSTVPTARRVGAMVAVRGVDPVSPIQGEASGYTSAGTTVTINTFTVDSTMEALELYLWATEIISPNSSDPVSVPGTRLALVPSSTGTGSTRTTIWAGSEVVSGSTSISGDALTWASVSGSWASAIVLRGVDQAPAPPAGFSSVDEMLAMPGATWAHRGGSANWPEMSEYAYRQAVAAGYGVLEFSAQRTSDGVWVGLHDASPNRTSQTTGLPDVSAMTWAQLQTYQNTLNSAGTPRPYYRLVDFLDAFTPTHVVVVDNKTNTAQAAFLDVLDAHGGNTKIIVKAYGVGTGGGVASAAAARGYRTWGYFYESDLPNIPTAQTAWSILGMEYNASASTWDQILTYGKPVVSHIIQSQANYDTAAAKGARMAQVANVASVTAVGASSIGAVGRLTLSGTATRAIELRRAAGGVLQVSGGGTRTLRIDRVSGGDLALSGHVDRTIGVSRTAVGALTVDGTAAASTGITRAATGPLTLHGQGEVGSEAVSRPATGHMTLTGVAAVTVAVVRSAVGVLILTGTGVIVRPAPEVPEVRTLTAIPVAHTLTPEITRRTLEDA